MKRLILLSLCLSAAASLASAAVRAQYRIVMKDGRVVVARDLPRQNGSVTTFHDGSGVLTGLPSEQIAKVETSVTPLRYPVFGAAAESDAAVHPLQPGEAIDLGPMGDGGSEVPVAGQAGAPNAGVSAGGANGAYANGVGGAYGGNGSLDARMLGGGGVAPTSGLLPNGQPANQAIAGDVLRAQSGNVPTMSLDTQTQTSNNGFPATISSQTATVNADGTPNIGPNGFPGTPQPVNGANGFPGTAAQPVIGPNGFPGTPQTPTDSNGFPTTGSGTVATQNGTGANGFPTTATGATPQNVSPNGFPAAGTTATGNGGVIVAPNGAQTGVAPNGAQTGVAPNGAVSSVAPQRSQSKAGAASAPRGGAAASSGPGSHGR